MMHRWPAVALVLALDIGRELNIFIIIFIPNSTHLAL